MTRSVFYNLGVERGRADDRAAAGARRADRAPRGLARRRPRRPLRARRRLAQPRSRVHDGADRGRGQRDDGAVVRPGALPLRLEPALAPRLPARGARARRVRVAAAADAPGDLGVRRRDDGRDDAVVPRRRPRRAPRAPPRATGSTSNEAAHGHRHRLGRARHGRAPARAARERRARGAARRHRHERALGRAAPVRRVPPRARRLRPGVPDA